MLERTLQKKILEILKSKNIYHVKIYGSGYSAKGAPDVIVCIDGRFVAFELKTGTNQMQADQVIHARRIVRNGGLHYTPRTVEEFTQILKTLGVD